MINKIQIENLTVFEKLEIDTSAPINVFIGENGTGKTQILKFINLRSLQYLKKEVNEELLNLITNNHLNLHQIARNTDSDTFIDIEIAHKAHNILKGVQISFVYIPAKDMLTHSKGLPAMKKEYGTNMPFDDLYINIIEKASKWNKVEVPKIAQKITPILENIMDGVVEIVNEVFYIKKRNGRMIPFDFEAEGIKKIGLLWQLLMNESITEGTILLWDEPESNLNPKLAKTIADMLLELSRNGVQIFLTTHSYFLAKYFDILEKDKKEVIFHSLYREDDNQNSPILCESSDTFTMLTQNSIMDEKIKLFETEMEWE